MRLLKLSFIMCLFLLLGCTSNTKYLGDLSGEWNFKLDPQDVGVKQDWFNNTFKDKIKLPGTTDEEKYGEKTVGSNSSGILSRVYKYIGVAWYNREITIPEKWKDKEITLFLERVLWQSKVYVDGKELDTKDALATPHVHRLGILKPGKHSLTLRIDNRLIHNIGDKGHSYAEYSQTIWNGVIGKIELKAQNILNIKTIRTFPNAEKSLLSLDVKLSKKPNTEKKLHIKVIEKHTNSILLDKNITVAKIRQKITIPIKNKIKQWDEFNPITYQLKATLRNNKLVDTYQTSFGFRKVSTSKSHILINGNPVFFRGNGNTVNFPLTGYPSMDVAAWKRIFKIYKDYGLNHIRFHSWCPPEAAFTAADELGIYIHAEASVWIDWWMALSKKESKGRPEMYTEGEPKGIGPDNPDATKFIHSEINHIIDTYGNHPSFVMLCVGNELGNSDFKVLGEWIHQAKIKDPRRLYAASTARTITPYCDYSVTHYYPGIGAVRQHMTNNTNWDYEKKYSQTPIPVIAHEIGQWPVYPLWSQINKYTGVLRARNLEGLRDKAKENGIFSQDNDLHQASGKLSILLYKDEIESFMRTPSCAGIQLLGIQDSRGLGEPLIGWLDCFYDSKETVTPKKVRQFYNSVVPLVKLPSYIFTAEDSLNSEVLLHNFGQIDLNNKVIKWSLSSTANSKSRKGSFKTTDYKKGKLTKVGYLRIRLPEIKKAAKYTLTINVAGTEYQNSWNIWIYPKTLKKKENSNILITDNLNKDAFSKLDHGGKVLLLANNCGDPSNSKYASWKPLYWSATFFPGQNIETLGLLIRDKHPAFADFPTDNFNSWQWWNICKGAHGFNLDSLPKNYKPIAQPVSDFHYSHKLGSIFELKYGKGKLLICGYNLSKERTILPEVRQLRYSLLNYMNSDKFKPTQCVNKSFLSEFKKIMTVASTTPKGFENAILYVKAAAKLKKIGNTPWKKETDNIVVAKKIDYKVENWVSYKDKTSSYWAKRTNEYWANKNLKISIKTPAGIKGDFYVFVSDKNDNDKVSINFEGRNYTLGTNNKNGKWVKFNVMREDTNDGKLILKAKGANLRISKIAFVPKN